MKKLILTSAICWVLQFTVFGQIDPLYSQYQFNQQMINPAYTGIYDRTTVSLLSRLQWVGIEGAPMTNTITGQQSMQKGKAGIGGVILQDRFGVNRNTEIIGSYSYNILFEKAKLAMGLQGGFTSFGFDYSGLELDYVDDPKLNQNQQNFSKPNFGAGLLFISDTYFVGLSIPRILDVSVSDGMEESTRYSRHYYLTGGIVFDANAYTKARVTGLVRYVDNGRLSAEINVSALIDKRAWGGLTLRDLRHLGIFTMFELTEKLRLGYSFELPANSLIRNSFGTHEISVFFRMREFRDPVLQDQYF